MKGFSYRAELDYYRRNWPRAPARYRHLERYLRAWLDPDAVFAGKRVLDIGAGECGYSRLIAERFAPAVVVACELFRQRMLPTIGDRPPDRLAFVAGDCFRLPFRRAVFDVVFGSGVLCQLPDLERVADEVGRVLGADGMYVGIEPNPLNALHLYRYLRGNHSANQYLLGRRHLAAFTRRGFAVEVRYFFARLPRLRYRGLTTCMGIVARRNR